MELFKASSSMIKYYTGFSSYCLLIDFANSLTLWSAVSEEVYNGSSDFLDHPVSDNEITRRSGILSLLERGDFVMCDKGFAIRSLLEVKGVGLNIPPFNFNGRFTYDALRSSKIASLRVHVERAIRRVKEYQLIEGRIPLSMLGTVTVNQLWTVACLLTNFSGPLF
uniref:uncharacterized protein LOC120337635 n=1 Tax=Styela clava TaxID=7725 RepID=UPI001939402E|nr:uncharacterized protein LOC120337635 [Styela clava]